jgi:hypothetical protein
MPRQTRNSSGSCDDFRASVGRRLARRELLQVGGVSLLSPGLLSVIAGTASAGGPRRARIKSCLLLFQAGGVSQTDTFDMKPDCDETIRGEFRPADSNVPGMPVCEHLRLVARQMDKVCVVRSVHHRMLCHNPAIYAALSGREIGDSLAVSVKTAATRDDYPHVGSMVARFGPECRDVPPFVAYPFQLRNGPTPSPGQHAGLLGRAYDPFVLVKDPNAADFQVDEIEFPAEVAEARLGDRRTLLQQIDAQQKWLEETGGVEALGEYYQRAYGLLTARRVKEAFDLSREKAALRDRYGRNTVGQSTLLGRRLVEAGVPFVTVYSPVAAIDGPSWDTHLDNFPRLKNELLPPADAALAALLEDMHERGLLHETLVIWAGEFGRTPQVGARRSNNSSNFSGRDHWPQCYTILMAGGGLPGGTYYGASDRLGWYPKENPIAVGDLAATILDAFGIDPRQTYQDSQGRPHVLAEGEPVAALWGA